MNILRGIATPLLVFLALAIVGNYRITVRQFLGHADSLIPLVGGLAGLVGFLVAPSPLLRRLFWLPVVVDPSCMVFPTAGVFALYNRLRRRITAIATAMNFVDEFAV